VLFACSPGPIPVSSSPRDPSNPGAAEGAESSSTVRASADLATAPKHAEGHGSAGPEAEHAGHAHASEAGHAHDASGSSTTQAWVCPMHPEVTSAEAGVCPKCNMKLVPKK
jgi:hypothetical protein